MNRKPESCLLLILLVLFLTVPVRSAVASADSPFIGEMVWVPFNFAPTGWAKCNGQILSISGNTALFSLLGTQYGGNGVSTFALPNMQGRVLISTNDSDGSLSPYYNGDSGGEEFTTLIAGEIPLHSHTLKVSAAAGTATSPAGAYFGAANSGKQYGDAPAVPMASQALSVAGSSTPTPHNNMMPYTTLNCIIALQGVFPARP